MKIRTEEELFDVVLKKIVKSRKKAIRKTKGAFLGSPKRFFKPFETLTTEITRDSLVPRVAFHSIISLDNVRKLNDKNPDKLDDIYEEGKTTVRDIISFFFPRKKKKKKKKH